MDTKIWFSTLIVSALEQALNAIEFALGGQPNTPRHRIEHNATVRPELIPRYSEVGVVAILFGTFPACSESSYPVPPENQAWKWPYREMIDANPEVHFAWHSDFPPAGPPISPLLHLYSIVTPYEIFSFETPSDGIPECPGPTWLDRGTFTVDKALPMMIIEGAYALFHDEEVGSLEPGKYAYDSNNDGRPDEYSGEIWNFTFHIEVAK